MVDFEKLQEIDSIIAGLEIASESARYMIQDVTDEYFSLTNEYDRDFYFNRGQVKCRIAHDYILEVKNFIERLLPIFSEVFNEARNETICKKEKASDIPSEDGGVVWQ